LLNTIGITLGFFLFAWSRNPEPALPPTDWVIVANLVHGMPMRALTGRSTGTACHAT
jgi:hypothetical protein